MSTSTRVAGSPRGSAGSPRCRRCGASARPSAPRRAGARRRPRPPRRRRPRSRPPRGRAGWPTIATSPSRTSSSSSAMTTRMRHAPAGRADGVGSRHAPRSRRRRPAPASKVPPRTATRSRSPARPRPAPPYDEACGGPDAADLRRTGARAAWSSAIRTRASLGVAQRVGEPLLHHAVGAPVGVGVEVSRARRTRAA